MIASLLTRETKFIDKVIGTLRHIMNIQLNITIFLYYSLKFIMLHQQSL